MKRLTYDEAWAASRAQLPAVLANPDVLDQLIIWRMSDPRYADRSNRIRSLPMQRQWTLEARADFADKAKFAEVNKLLVEVGVYLNAAIKMLCEHDRLEQKPQVVVFSEDFFAGHEEIDLMPNTLKAAIDDHGDKVGSTTVSDDMMTAMQELRDASK